MTTVSLGRRSAAVALLVGTLGASCLTACGADHAVTTKGPYRVGTRSETFVDESRETPAFRGAPALPNRTLVTDFWYPAAGDPQAGPIADGAAADGPFPLIVFNHGQNGSPDQYALSFQTWAAAGYVVAAPRHPITVRGGGGGQLMEDLQGEMADDHFVIESIHEQLSDLADTSHLAVAGHSSGALVAWYDTFSSCCHKDDIDAVLVEGIVDLPIGGDLPDDLKGTPVMFIHGDADATPPSAIRPYYDQATPPKYFLTIPGGDHSAMYRNAPAEPLVAEAALDFFDLHIKHRHSMLLSLQRLPGMEADP
jgi:predicted esterase